MFCFGVFLPRSPLPTDGLSGRSALGLAGLVIPELLMVVCMSVSSHSVGSDCSCLTVVQALLEIRCSRNHQMSVSAHCTTER